MKEIKIGMTGLRPLMFDRYAGDNNTKLPPEEKMYFAPGSTQLIIPALNIYSLLTAELGKSVCRMFFGKSGKSIAMGINAYTNIMPHLIPILDGKGKEIHFKEFNEQIYIHHAIARVKATSGSGGIPNPKTRPVLALPWNVNFTMSYIENELCSLENLRQALVQGGTIALGTFRPFFGRYELTTFEVMK